jgi:hypothetical protein
MPVNGFVVVEIVGVFEQFGHFGEIGFGSIQYKAKNIVVAIDLFDISV